MRKLMIAAACTALLAACTPEPEAAPVTSTPDPSAEAATADADAATASCPEVDSPLPEGLVIDLPVHLAADRITTTANDQVRRVTTLEYLEGTQEDVMAQVRASLTAAGYNEKADPNERETPVFIFQKKGTGAIHVAFPETPDAGASHPSAQGRLVVNSPFEMEAAAG